MKYQTVIAVPWRVLVLDRVKKIQMIFNFDLKFVSVLSNVDRKYDQCTYTKKRGSRSDFNAEMYSWFIQRRGGTIASLFFLSENSISLL